MAFDFYLDPLTGDLPSVKRGTRGGELILQRIRVRLNTHKGEIWEDKTAGLPFKRWASDKLPDLDEVAAYMRREVQAVPGVLRVDDVSTRVVGGEVRTEMTVVGPTDDALRVRLDLLRTSRSSERGEGAVVGSDPEPVVASPIVVVTLIDPFIGL